MGLLGGGAAVSRGAAAVYDNPAQLADLRHPEALIAGLRRQYAVTVSRGGGADKWPTRAPSSLSLGTASLAVPLTRRLAVGVLVHLPLGGPSRLLSYEHRSPQLPLWQGLGERLAIAGSFGFRVTRWLSIGATAHVAADLDARASFGLSLAEGAYSHQELDVHLRSRVVPTLAATLSPGHGFRLSLRWRDAYAVTYAVPLRLDVKELGPVDLVVSGAGLLSPETFTLAGALELGPSLVLVGAVRFERWSELQPLSPRVTVSGQDSVSWLSAAASPPPIGAVDTFNGHGGLQWQASRSVAIRGAIGFRPTPLPQASGAASWLDSHAIEVGGGLSWRALPTLEVDIGLAWSHLLRRRVVKSDPSDPIEFVEISGDIIQFALSFRHTLN